MRHTLILLAAGLLALPAAANKPNVIVFLSDDVGYGEYGFQGNAEIPTPNIDAIARNGVRFTSGYVSGPYCSPTRAGLLTGRYQTRFGHEFNGGGPAGGKDFGLPTSEKTIADRLKELGYATACVGKWHLGHGPQFIATARGFDEFYGTVANTPYLNPPNFIDTRKSPDITPVKDDAFYTTDAYADRAVDWIDKQKGKPFFLYLPFNAQHAPLQAPPKYLDRFKHIAHEERRKFAAVMSAKDDAVGKVMARVKEMGQEENTLVFFFSDNGGPTMRGTTINGSSNAPLRGSKRQTWEGGIRVPFIIQWKGHLAAGTTDARPIIQLDVLPTALAAAGADAGKAPALDGVDLLPFLTGKAKGAPHETLYWRLGGMMAIRHGEWKLVKTRAGAFVDHDPAVLSDLTGAELYNLADDVGESKNLAAVRPDKVKELSERWQQWNRQLAKPRWSAAGGGDKAP